MNFRLSNANQVLQYTMFAPEIIIEVYNILITQCIVKLIFVQLNKLKYEERNFCIIVSLLKF